MRIWQHPKPSFPAWPANTSRCKSYYNLQQDNSFHSGASRPIPPATILSIPAPQSSISQLPSSRLGRPTPYIPSYHFFNIHKASSSHQVSLPTILLKSTNKNLSKTSSRRISVIFPDITTHHSTHLLFSIFPFSISSPTSSRPSSFRTSNSNLIPPLSQRPPLLPFCCRFSNPQAKRETSLRARVQPARLPMVRARSPRFFFYFFLLLSFLSPFSSHWRRGFAATPSFFFLFFLFIFFLSFCFCFYFCFFFLFFYFFIFAFFSLLFFLFIFLLIFYSCFFFVLSFCFCSYLCFLVFYFYVCFTFIFAFFVFSLCFFFLAFIFDSPFLFCLSFCFTFLPSSLQSLSSLSNRSPTIHFFSSDANLSHSLQPLLGSSKKKKISAKESTGVEWPPGSEWAAGGKAEGRNGMK